jgi:two-component system NtrC family sensor kinase
MKKKPLSYDIITKEHDGTIKAETKEGEFAEFIIQLPAKNNINTILFN